MKYEKPSASESVEYYVNEAFENPSINLHKVLQAKSKEELIEYIVMIVKMNRF
jgi:hypothetical protein